ncbi:cation diffusion facilitator 10 [Stemphylium lycopersici]|uniref:Cation diffusion facilitator 10 n=1 Tax=Stemphylium lycopersici TaxID=183478 RepID=A0A364N4D6_STELY|nr:cation diffusion facilitator 10 [Stemphylium lycopersici]RAR06684.1 cation diffusion facilitator 10 [Stemphylium lycopersici]RAR11064.1 cation diffusion facilitator 10 [Stemphylium lycopersici]
MVGSRRNLLSSHASNGNVNSHGNPEQFNKYQRVDLESGYGAINPIKPKQRFRDAIEQTLKDNRASNMKRQLIDNVDHGALEIYRKSEESLKSIRNKKVRQFYEAQNERLDDWAEVDMVVSSLADDIVDSMNPRDPDHDGVAEDRGPLGSSGEDLEPFLPEEEREKRRKSAKHVRWAININVLVNILLLAAKGVAAIWSNSLSLIASLVDSALDLLCTVIIWVTNKLVGWRLQSLRKKFPIGRRRLEPIGILVFSIIMVISFLQILQESVNKLLPSGDHSVAMLPPAAIFAMVATIVVKGTIWIGCARVKTTQVQALAQDCKTDVYFNTLSLLFPLIGAQIHVWWLDPLGAAGLSLFIIYDWACTCFENVTRLTGEAASDRVERKMMYMAYRFAPLVEGFKSLKVYHAGDGVCVEIDVLMNEGTPLRRCHDIAETLQYCLEGLNEVDRAFVTMDYTEQGPTGHADS